MDTQFVVSRIFQALKSTVILERKLISHLERLTDRRIGPASPPDEVGQALADSCSALMAIAYELDPTLRPSDPALNE